MNIVVATRCLNESENIYRFLKGYEFATHIVVSEGGSTDDSMSKLQDDDRVHIVPFEEYETHNGHRWNPDNNHIQHCIDEALKYDPDWLILDDMDDVPNYLLRQEAAYLLSRCDKLQVNAYRLYLWGDGYFFPDMNGGLQADGLLHDAYRSVWAWQPKKIKIGTDKSVKHGTLIGLAQDGDIEKIHLPFCLLHKSWHPDTIQAKLDRYNSIGLPMHHPLSFAGKPERLPSWAVE